MTRQMKPRRDHYLTADEVQQIKTRAANGEKQITLAQEFNLDKSAISKIISGDLKPVLPRISDEMAMIYGAYVQSGELCDMEGLKTDLLMALIKVMEGYQ